MTMIDEKAGFQKGFTWRSGLALIFSICVIQLAVIYYMLLTNISLPLQAWFVILLWSEISRLLGSPLTRQELFILLSFQYALAGGYALTFLNPIMTMYYATTPESFALGISQYVPSWAIPSPLMAESIYMSKWVYLNSVWVYPILLMLTATGLEILANISMGYFAYAIFVRGQKLEFPAAKAQAETIITLAERDPKQTRYLMISALLGAIYNLFVSFLPFILGPFLSTGGTAVYGVVSPIAAEYDLTPVVSSSFPGLGLSFSLNMMLYIPGFLLPVGVTLSQFIGAVTFYMIGTYLITNYNLWPEEAPYSQSWPLATLVERSRLYFFWSIIIGLSLAAAFVPLITRPKAFIQSFSVLRRHETETERTEGPHPYLLLALFFGATLGSVALVYYLTHFPIWLLLLFTVGGSFFATFLAVNSAGVTFSGFNIPYLKELMIYSSRWGGREIWFAPVTMYTGGSNVAIAFGQADLLNASKSEYVRTFLIVVALGMFASFAFVSYLWNISPIPSGAYPATITDWPVLALNWARFQVWVFKGYIFKENLILWSFLGGAVVYVLTAMVLRKPYFLIAFITGTMFTSPISISLAQLIGSILARKIVAPMLDRNEPGAFNRFRGRFVMGVTIGWGFMELTRALLILVGRSMWLLPF